MLNVSYGPLFSDTLHDDMLGALLFATARPASAASPLLAHVHMARLDDQQSLLCETLRGESTMRDGQFGDMHYRFNDHLLFGVIALKDNDTAVEDNAASPLQAAAHAAYRQIFSLLHAQGFPYVLRFWNYMAAINADTHGLERYRQFNLGRQQAFADSGQAIAGNVPAACALGAADGPLTIAFLAARSPSVAIENPRQISAYDYPEQYGPRSPLFSRASVATLGTQRVLFLSGTASIVGHETLHADDIAAQTAESVANIAAVLAEARRKTGASCQLADLDYIVYIRHAEHLQAVRNILHQQIGPDIKAAFVQADICRADLLVEIEGSAILS
ncbi:hypothetical protein [uncultured Oxalicibacterium sp.]|uniref:chorismate transformation enzyme, FkbO/Hyg5 family n=1 Tax=uncultured Oxalicibacterium sp. TaxID=1168540 RepID=UPI0025CF39B6|nr:hypothetical protein [uncultured Oxalicibacterium sp.]